MNVLGQSYLIHVVEYLIEVASGGQTAAQSFECYILYNRTG